MVRKIAFITLAALLIGCDSEQGEMVAEKTLPDIPPLTYTWSQGNA